MLPALPRLLRGRALLRRYPRLGPSVAVGAVGSGVVLFILASVTTPLAAEPVAVPKLPARAVVPTEPAVPYFSIDPAAPAVKLLKRNPTHVKHKASVSHGVISGLAANGIPQVALNAYRVAAARMAYVEPSCGIDWALLAGIGREESDHGRFGGAVLHADGVSTPAIIGPALDGKHWDYIPAPANGLALDGDAKYAHALGPMQFIPQTWAIYGTDATGDGRADIFNINDAALGAARYLCAAGGNLRTERGQIRAVLAYNHSDQYLAQVLALADAYRRGIPITGIPVGITKGKLPGITDTGYIPPANPGGPTANQPPPAKHKPRTPAKTSSAAPSRTAAASTTKAAAPSSSAAPSGSSSTASGSTGSATASPSPSPSPTCGPLQHLLHQC
jgi:hypothetical protein